MTLDKFDRATVVNDPVDAANFVTTYRADGLPATVAAPNSNTTTFAYDAAGHLTSKDSASGATVRSNYDWTVNRAGQVLSEAATVTGDASNGTVTYGYDPLGRLVGATLAGTTTAYGWDKVPNRTSVQVGAGTAVTTSYNNADRPTTDSAGGAYSSDDDGRLTARPGQQLTWDRLGRLAQVKNGSGTVLASYTYDPLDRLRLIDYGGGVRIRFRYVGLTTAVAQWLDDAAGTVTRSVGTGWSGERLLDWTGTGANIRVYGTNGHHDTTWLASSTGTVSQSLRYDPWGSPRSAVPSGYSPFRFQGSYLDATTDLAWVVTRWYAPALGRFVSEDSLLGEPADPPSRHLYAYGQGEPVGRWDPDGMRPITYWDLYGDTRARYATRTFNPRGIGGRVRLALFIPEKRLCVPFPISTICGAGDNRGFSNPYEFNCLRSRVCITVDLNQGQLSARANPSCGLNRDCRSAHRWSNDTYGTFVRRVNAVHVNDNFKADSTAKGCSKRVNVTWSAVQAYYDINLPAIDGSFTARRCGRDVHFRVTGDGFPNFEMSYVDGRERLLARLRVSHAGDGDANGSQYLVRGLGDWTKTFKVTVPVYER